MVYKRFSVLVILRVLLLVANSLGLAYVVVALDWLFTPFILTLLLVYQIIELIRFVNRTNNELSKLFLAIRHSDFSIGFSHRDLGSGFDGLSQEFSEVIRAFRENRIEKEAQYQYFKILAEQLTVGIISVDAAGKIELMNHAAEELLQAPNPGSWERLKSRLGQFAELVWAIPSGGNRLVEWTDGEEEHHFSVQVNVIRVPGRESKVITFQNIRSELELKEIKAWHKLIRILTHEIMNSVTPIASLTETLVMLLENDKQEQRPISELNEEVVADVRKALTTIQRRSNGLLHFVSDYRKLTKVPVPKLEPMVLLDLFHRLENLFQAEFENMGIHFNMQPPPPHMRVEADPRLIEQVMINLLVNAKDAVLEVPAPRLTVSAFRTQNNTYVEVSDNGAGIQPQHLEKVFVPFFSTKEEGSGIGLSLSRHIMKMHQGTIKVHSQPDEKTTFRLVFRSI